MTQPVQLFCWHFMSYPYAPADFDDKYDTAWITVPNKLWDREKSKGLLNGYIDQLAYADTVGFDGMVLNEHHQNIYGLMPSPNIIASALTQKTSHGKIVVLANLLPLHGNPLRVAEEYAMLDNMSNGRVIAGLAPGGGQETFNYNTPAAIQREQFWEAVDLIEQAWTREGPFAFEGKHYPLRYVNPWPQPQQLRIRRSGFPARSRGRPCASAHGAGIATSCRRACTAAPSRGREGIQQDPAGRRQPLRSVPHGHPDVGLRLGDRRAGARGGARGRLVLPQELPEGPSAQLPGPLDDLRAWRAERRGRRLPAHAGEHQARPSHAGRRRRLGRASRRNRSSSAARTPSIGRSSIWSAKPRSATC